MKTSKLFYKIAAAVILALVFIVSFNQAEAGSVKFTGKPCGNAIINGVHLYGGDGIYSPVCSALRAMGMAGIDPNCTIPKPPPPKCPVSNECIGNNLYTINSDCSTTITRECTLGCVNNACVPTTCPDGSPTPANGICPSTGNPTGPGGGTPPGGPAIGACVVGTSCVSAPNSCGMIEGTLSCPSRICVPPANSLCDTTKQCTGPDGVLIDNGDTRSYYTDASCSSVQQRDCINGSLSGSASLSECFVSGGVGGAGSAPVIAVFRITPPIVNDGESCNIQWTAQNADNCTLTGTAIPAGGWNAEVPSGSLKTPPITSDSSYTLKCVNQYGSATKVGQCNLNPKEKEI